VIAEKIEAAAFETIDEFDKKRGGDISIRKHISTTIGAQPTVGRGGHVQVAVGGGGQSHLAEVNIELLGAEERDLSSTVVKNRWRELVGEVAGASSLTFISEFVSTGDPINVELSHRDFDMLLAASEKLKSILRDYTGVDTGRTLGLTLSDLARQVRQGFYGDEAQRIQRGRDDIRVMVRYPEADRRSLADVENMRIRLPSGTEIPFDTVAEVQYGRGYSAIKRIDRKRVVSVSADVDQTFANANVINRELAASVMPELAREFSGVQYRFGGEQREMTESLGSLKTNFIIAMMAIYGLLAVQFKSYSQPAIIMSAIPFGIVGAAFGHLLMGYNFGIMSMFGIVALSGVVVNDYCATRRFRPIMLTTLTTFFGLLPMITERSLQARFLIPMAISLAFGVMFATCITLVLVPSLYMILEDVKVRIFGA